MSNRPVVVDEVLEGSGAPVLVGWCSSCDARASEPGQDECVGCQKRSADGLPRKIDLARAEQEYRTRRFFPLSVEAKRAVLGFESERPAVRLDRL